jgi:AraC-like DNA-binding protein
MNITYKKPTGKVSEYVQDILVIENYHVTIPFCLPLFANGTPTLLFHTAQGQFKKNSGYLTLFGQTILPDKLQIKENFTLIAYFLRPYSLISLFGISAQELTDKPVDFNLLSKRTGLQEQLLNSDTVNEMILLLDNYIFSLIPKNGKEKPLIKYAAAKILDSPTKNILSEIQKDICVTERTLQRMFEKNIGVSPNQFRKIHQFNRAFRQLNNRQFQNLIDIAYDNGYADQSHYIRAFKEFTNITPKEYLHLGIAG